MQEPEFKCQVRIPGAFVNVAFSPDGRCLVTGGEGATVKVWDVQTGRELETLRGHTGDVCSVAFSSDGRWLATAGEDTTVRIWDATSWKLRQAFQAALDMEPIIDAAAGHGLFYRLDPGLWPPELVFQYSTAGAALYNKKDKAKARRLLKEADYTGQPVRWTRGRDDRSSGPQLVARSVLRAPPG